MAEQQQPSFVRCVCYPATLCGTLGALYTVRLWAQGSSGLALTAAWVVTGMAAGGIIGVIAWFLRGGRPGT